MIISAVNDSLLTPKKLETITLAYTSPEGMPGRVSHSVGMSGQSLKINNRSPFGFLFAWCLFFSAIKWETTFRLCFTK